MGPQTQGFGPNSGSDYVNGMDLEGDNFALQTKNQPYVDQVRDVFGNAGVDRDDGVVLAGAGYTGGLGSGFSSLTAAQHEAMRRAYGPRTAESATTMMERDSAEFEDGFFNESQRSPIPASLARPAPNSPSFLQNVGRFVNAAVNTMGELPLMAVDTTLATLGLGYTGLMGKPVDMPQFSFTAAAARDGATTSEMLHAANPAYGAMVAKFEIEQAIERGDTGKLYEMGGMVAGGLAGFKGATALPGYEAGLFSASTRAIAADVARTVDGVFGDTASAIRSEAAANIREARNMLRDAGVPLQTRNEIIRSFELESFRVERVASERSALRVFDDFNARLEGRFVSTDFFASQTDRIQNFSLMKNSATRLGEVTIPEGSVVFTGRVAPQPMYGLGLTGGANQIFLTGPLSRYRFGEVILPR
jgi:hypothetical protein